MIILDTNVLSETLKPLPSELVVRWLDARVPLGLFITAVTAAEVLRGIELMPAGKRRTRLLAQAERVFAEDFADRVLPFDGNAAHLYATIVAARVALGRPIGPFDAMIAAIARCHRAQLATRNVADFEHCGIGLINPWEAPTAVRP